MVYALALGNSWPAHWHPHGRPPVSRFHAVPAAVTAPAWVVAGAPAAPNRVQQRGVRSGKAEMFSAPGAWVPLRPVPAATQLTESSLGPKAEVASEYEWAAFSPPKLC